MAAIPEFAESHLQAICDVLGDTGSGLTGSEIDQLLRRIGVDSGSGSNKRSRLLDSLSARQRRDRCGNLVVAFVKAAMEPVSYRGRSHVFDARRQELNEALAFCGYELREDGELVVKAAVKTLGEAEERAGRLRAELRRRNVHSDVLAFCRAELLEKNCFHAVLEATKSVAEKIRKRSGLSGDGAALIDQAFGLGSTGMPFLAFNALSTPTERDEHTGLMNLMKGLFGAFRNPTAHAPRISWPVSEQDAIDLLTMASLLHRRLDGAIRTPRTI